MPPPYRDSDSRVIREIRTYTRHLRAHRHRGARRGPAVEGSERHLGHGGGAEHGRVGVAGVCQDSIYRVDVRG